MTPEFFGFLDDDDEYLPGAFSTRLNELCADSSADVVVTNGFERVDNDDWINLEHPELARADPLRALLRENWLASCAVFLHAIRVKDRRFNHTTPRIWGLVWRVERRLRIGRPLTDAVVVAFPSDGNLRLTAKPRDDAIFQVDKEFVPKVTPVLVGTAVAFPNNDTVRHHVYTFSPAKKFELPLHQGVPAKPVVFDMPGVVVLGCNIHDWMVMYIYVSESPYFAKTGADGKATISDLAPRAYVLRPGTRSSRAKRSRRASPSMYRKCGVARSRGR